MFNDFYEESSNERSYALHVVGRIENSSRSRIWIRMDLVTFGEEITMGLYFVPIQKTLVSSLVQFFLLTIKRIEIILKSIIFNML